MSDFLTRDFIESKAPWTVHCMIILCITTKENFILINLWHAFDPKTRA